MTSLMSQTNRVVTMGLEQRVSLMSQINRIVTMGFEQ